MEKYLFTSWHQFKTCFLAGCEKFVWGICRIVTALFLGVFSLIRAFWQYWIKSVAQKPKTTIVTELLAIFLTFGLTYSKMKTKLVSAEFHRDSISYRLSKFEAMYDNDTDSVIVVRKAAKNDTIKIK